MIEIKMKKQQHHSHQINRLKNSLLLLSVNTRLVTTLVVVVGLWIVLNNLIY